MKKILFVCIICVLSLLGISNTVSAQEYAPQTGDKIVSLRLGKAVSVGYVSYNSVNQVANGSQNTHISQPNSVANDFTNNNIVNAIGIEAKYFLKSNIALRFAGSGILSASPAQDVTEGVQDPDGNNYPGTTIPAFRHLEGKATKQFYLDLGADYYFATKIARLQPYLGVQLNSNYGQLEIFDGYRGLDGGGEVIPTYDTRRGEAYGLGGSVVGGVDYYLAEGLFLGLEIKAASYMYNVNRIFHQPGMEAQEAATHNTSFLTQPVIKLGFKF